jgi:hypothetical protein
MVGMTPPPRKLCKLAKLQTPQGGPWGRKGANAMTVEHVYFENTPPPEGKEDFAVASVNIFVQHASSDLCVSCGETLDMTRVDAYDHAGGWLVLTGMPKQWLSIKCNACGYEVSLTKLGVPR